MQWSGRVRGLCSVVFGVLQLGWGIGLMLGLGCLLISGWQGLMDATDRLGTDPGRAWLFEDPAESRPPDLSGFAVEDRRVTSPLGLRLVLVPPGEFVMGSPPTEDRRGCDELPHRVRISRAFYLGATEVTVRQFRCFVSETGYQTEAEQDPSRLILWLDCANAASDPGPRSWRSPWHAQGEDHPVVCVTWNDAAAFCAWLAEKEGRPYRLPTEAEWEYACRAGTTTAYSFGDDPEKLEEYAWFAENSDDRYQKVGQKKPNPWGLHDMHGNVTELVLHQYVPDLYKQLAAQAQPVANPLAPVTKEYPQCVRGGSWQDDPEMLRSAVRRGSHKDWKMQDPQIPQSIWYFTDATFSGFRVVRPLRAPTEADAKLYEPDPKIRQEYKEAQGGKE